MSGNVKTTGNKKKTTRRCTIAVMKNCKYGKCIAGDAVYCAYLEIEGKRRGCNPKECDKYESKRKKKN